MNNIITLSDKPMTKPDSQPALAGTPKEEVIRFLRESTYDKPHSIWLEGSEKTGAAFLQSMRTELSRMRKYVKSRGSEPKPFKMIRESIVEHSNGLVEIRIKMTGKVVVDMASALSHLSLGEA